MVAKILVVDDEPLYARLVGESLKVAGYQVLRAYSGAEAIELVAQQHPDLVVLDVMMPDMDGFTVCRRIREFSNLPSIMLTSKTEEKARVAGLDTGADDYITKPFSGEEFLARIRAVLRRATSASQQNTPTTFTHGDLRIDFARAEVFRGDKMVFLSATEYRLLLQFAHNLGRVLSSEELLANVWGEEYTDNKEILWVSISRLRQKLERDPKNPVHIVTRSGQGYLMPAVLEKI
ncbi:MAG: DNA-binding response regulator [Anaerolineae bacterium]|nr:MAG: DNA-binding response regulator [Anaerolineae bacterium]